jgi:hypothetical protein
VDTVKNVIAIALIIIVVLIVTIGFMWDHETTDEAHRKCLLAGFPEMTRRDGQYFCWRTVDGTDEVRPVEDLE